MGPMKTKTPHMVLEASFCRCWLLLLCAIASLNRLEAAVYQNCYINPFLDYSIGNAFHSFTDGLCHTNPPYGSAVIACLSTTNTVEACYTALLAFNVTVTVLAMAVTETQTGTVREY